MNMGIIFDWDGVIIRSNEIHQESWELIAKEEGLPLQPGFFQAVFGLKNENIILNMLRWTENLAAAKALSNRKEELFRLLLTRKKIDPLPGVKEFIDELHSAAVPFAVGSSTDRKNIEVALDHMGFENKFHTIVAAEDVGLGKPDPDVFLICAERLDLSPKSCIVIEDAPLGIEAARRAGMKVVAVTTTHEEDALQEADLIVDTLEVLTLTGLSDLLGIDPAA